MRFRRTKQLHFVGIGGAGMSGIAEILLNTGYTVSGSDLADSETVRHLREAGATITIGHKAKNVADAEVVIISSAIRPTNPEVVEAKSRFIPVIKRAQMLAELMRMKYAIAVAGSHGKTTVTSMTAVILSKGDLDPTIIIGGRVDRFGSGARLGKGDFLVAEADESDGSFLNLYSTIAIVTNIDAEHMDYYGSYDKVKSAFVQFINKTPFYGASILCLDDPAIQEIIPKVEKRFWTYGIRSTADVTAHDIKYDKFHSSFNVKLRGEDIGRLNIGMPGIHNVYNALAAMTCGFELDMDPDDVISSLDNFGGIQRRVELKGERDGVMVIDDYGHHPNEIKATLRGIKEGFKDRRLVVAFQPHRYSRTRDHLVEFGKSFYDADDLIVSEIYAAGEDPIEDISGKQIADVAMSHGQKAVTFIKDIEGIVEYLIKNAKKGDIILTLGAGNILTAGDMFLEKYGKNPGK